jgi:hypothetical protein
MPITAATVGTLAALGVAEKAAPLIGQAVGSLSKAGRARREMIREAIARRQSGKYGMSAAEKRQMTGELVGTPAAGDVSGSVGQSVGPLSGAIAAARLARFKEMLNTRARAGGEVAQLSTEQARQQKILDDKTIADKALADQKLGAQIASTAVDATAGAIDDVKEGRDKRASQAADARVKLDAAGQAAMKSMADVAGAFSY